MNNLQNLRQSNTGLDKEMQASLIKNRTWPYTNLADLLVAEGRIPEAQQVLQMLKERELYEDVLRGGGAEPSTLQATLVGVERTKHEEYYRITLQQVAMANERRQIEATAPAARSAAQKQRLAEIFQQFETVRAAMNAFMASLQKDLNRMSRGDADVASKVADVQSKLRKTVEKLAAPGVERDARAVALQYVVTDKRVSIILTVPGGPEVARQIDIDYKRLAGLVNQFSADLKSAGDAAQKKRIQDQARELHRILIEPILPELKKADARTVMLSLTDVLRFMPFAALYDGKRYLVEDYTLALFNEAATELERASRSRWRVAGFGLSEPVEKLQALDAVPAELDSVTRPWAGSNEWLNNRSANPFNRDTLQSALEGNYDVLHLASHFVVELGNTAGSKLYLGDKSTLSLEQLRNSEAMKFDRIDLVTLSACETAVGGGRTSYGQEMESLGATVQKSGAAAVMATLWKVADSSTGSLMASYYEYKSKGSNKAQALRQAQVQMLQAKGSRKAGDAGKDWSHPFYWAPFVLMGNWR